MNSKHHPAVRVFRTARDPAISHWATELSGVSDHRVTAIRVNECISESEEELEFTLGTLLALLELKTVNPPVYLRQWPSGDWPQSLHDATANLIGPNCTPLLRHMCLWIGTASAFTPTHADDTDNAVFLLRGCKRFRLWPAETNFGKGPPLGAEAHFPHYDLTLGPGEVLFLPANWAHHVSSPEGAISINAWHADVHAMIKPELRG